MEIREARLDDLDGILGLYAELNREDPPVIDGRDERTLEIIVGADWLHLFVGELDGRAIATCYLNVAPNLSRDVAPYGSSRTSSWDERAEAEDSDGRSSATRSSGPGREAATR